MQTFQRTTLVQTQRTIIWWKRVIAAGVLSELAVVIVLSLVLAVYAFLIAPGRSKEEYGEFAQNAGYYVSPPAATLAVFLMALWAVGKLESGFVVNGLLVGVIGTLLTVPMMAGARPGDRWVYILSFILRIAAGYAAGFWMQRFR